MNSFTYVVGLLNTECPFDKAELCVEVLNTLSQLMAHNSKNKVRFCWLRSLLCVRSGVLRVLDGLRQMADFLRLYCPSTCIGAFPQHDGL